MNGPLLLSLLVTQASPASGALSSPDAFPPVQAEGEASAPPPREPGTKADPPALKESLTLPPREAWQEPGLRVFLGYRFGSSIGMNNPLSSLTHEFQLDVGAQLSRHWALMLELRYGSVGYSGRGLIYSGLARAEYHFDSGLFAGAGIGLTGLFIPTVEAGSIPDFASELEASYTQPNTEQLVTQCTGNGLGGQALIGYRIFGTSMFVVDFRLMGEIRQTMCFDDLDRENPETGEAIGIRQLWRFAGVSGAFLLGFR